MPLGAVDHDETLRRDAHRARGGFGLGKQRAHRDEPRRPGILQLLLDLPGRVEGVECRHGGAGAEGAVEHGRERGDVGAQQAHDGVGADTTLGEGAREGIHLRAQCAVGRLGARRRIDQRHTGEVAVGEGAEQVVVDARGRDLDSGVGAVEHDFSFEERTRGADAGRTDHPTPPWDAVPEKVGLGVAGVSCAG